MEELNFDALLGKTNEDKPTVQTGEEKQPVPNSEEQQPAVSPEALNNAYEREIGNAAQLGIGVENPTVRSKYEQWKREQQEKTTIQSGAGGATLYEKSAMPQSAIDGTIDPNSLINELKTLEAEKAQLEEAAQALAQVVNTVPQPPKVPENFSLAEAQENPQSASARYLREKEQYEIDLKNYQLYSNQYYQVTQILSDYNRKIENNKNYLKTVQEKQFKQALSSVISEIKTQFNPTEDELRDFIGTMSRKQELTPDELWVLYRYNKQRGGTGSRNTNIQQQPQPSPQFNHIKQQQTAIPSPMGVMPNGGVGAQPMSDIDLIQRRMVESDRATSQY